MGLVENFQSFIGCEGALFQTFNFCPQIILTGQKTIDDVTPQYEDSIKERTERTFFCFGTLLNSCHGRGIKDANGHCLPFGHLRKGEVRGVVYDTLRIVARLWLPLALRWILTRPRPLGG